MRLGAEVRVLLTGRSLRAFADGYVAVLLPAYLFALGFGQIEVGLLSTATLAGSAIPGAIGLAFVILSFFNPNKRPPQD